MNEISLSVLLLALAILILLSAFFSGSETGMMALNRYRLRHQVDKGHRGAKRASALLERPDRLIGLILLGNNFVNILASSIATIIALRFMGQAGIALAAGLLTLVILIFAEVTPKTLAALKPERVAFPAAYILTPLLKLFYPIVAGVNIITNALLGLFGIRPGEDKDMALSREELRTVVKEAGTMISHRHQEMLFGILDLEKVTVEDIMVPRNEITGIDLEDEHTSLKDQLNQCRHTRMPVYRGNIEELAGMLHVRNIPALLEDDEKLTPESLTSHLADPYYVPIGTPLHTQLANFQKNKRRVGLIVDEYGDIEGLVTLEDILEEIVGEFTTDAQMYSKDVSPQEDGTFLVDGTASIRELNRTMNWHLPASGPKTLNGLLLEMLENIPETGTTLRIGDYTIEIMQAADQVVKTTRITAVPEADPENPDDKADGDG